MEAIKEMAQLGAKSRRLRNQPVNRVFPLTLTLDAQTHTSLSDCVATAVATGNSKALFGVSVGNNLAAHSCQSFSKKKHVYNVTLSASARMSPLYRSTNPAPIAVFAPKVILGKSYCTLIAPRFECCLIGTDSSSIVAIQLHPDAPRFCTMCASRGGIPGSS